MTYHQELQHRLFQQQEEQVHHMEYQQEFQYYEDVANGRLDRIHLQLPSQKILLYTMTVNMACSPKTPSAICGIILLYPLQ